MNIPQPEFTLVGKRHAKLTADYDAGPFIVPAGFHFDGATIPRLVWSVIGISPFGTIVGPACGHDFLYATCGRFISKLGRGRFYSELEADNYFYGRCQADNVEMRWLQERLVRRAVLWFGDYDIDGTSNVYQWNKDWIEGYLERYNASL